MLEDLSATDADGVFFCLADDGFQFSLFGGNTSLTLDQNGLNPRDRYGFDQNFLYELR